MALTAPSRAPQAAVGVVCLRAGEILLVRRRNAPRAGEWSIPGGRIEWGETAAAAAIRELREETGVSAELLGLIDVIDAFHPNQSAPTSHHVLVDFAARWLDGEPCAGDDALDARFVPRSQLNAFHLWPETLRVIGSACERWGPT